MLRRGAVAEVILRSAEWQNHLTNFAIWWNAAHAPAALKVISLQISNPSRPAQIQIHLELTTRSIAIPRSLPNDASINSITLHASIEAAARGHIGLSLNAWSQ